MNTTTLLAPNGKPSNLTPQQHALVRTPAFIVWFGDWINNPEASSKVVDENGEPLVVYHGSNENFNFFNIDKIWTNYVKPSYDAPDGFYFAKDKKLAIKYGKNVKAYFIGNGNLLLNNNKIVVTNNPNQIKLADGTNTTFDNETPDIRFETGGIVMQDTRQSILDSKDNDFVYLYHATSIPVNYIKTSDKSNFSFADKGYVYLATNPQNAIGYVKLNSKKAYLYKVKVRKSELLPDIGYIKTYGGKNTLKDSLELYGLARIKRPIYGNEIELIKTENFQSGGITPSQKKYDMQNTSELHQQLIAAINTHLDLCEMQDTPVICGMINEPENRQKVIDAVIDIILKQKLDVPQAIIQLDNMYNINHID